MQVEAVAAKRSRVHTRYYNREGKLLPGVTTVLGVLNKPALGPWHNKMGLQGIDTAKYVDAMALIGTIGHQMICDHNRGVPFQTNGHPAELIDKAENCFLSYLAWEKQHIVEPILCEAGLVSETYGYGGTVDMLANVDGVPTLIDYKTSRALYAEHMIQVAAYFELLIENGHRVQALRVLRIGRDETEGFAERVIGIEESDKCFDLFCHALKIYHLQKQIHA